MGRSAEPRDLTEWEGLNTDFHPALVGAAGSVWLLRMRGMMYQHHERYRQLSRRQPANQRDVHEEHRAV
ncbi:FCD domain-containing protein [Neotabrizicola sp. sgz301269]|uniref:FCD domain-containing protein n=1 Tax=Neotabrizicola sp. sgz301269 TaxID=3276282 RepID=UPI00376FEFD9